ncbi:MAG: hypothetical protein H7301_06495 [Cryobacterium sp.]|nr:hypothetical protein [Oligoflexia bacterium]
MADPTGISQFSNRKPLQAKSFDEMKYSESAAMNREAEYARRFIRSTA